MTRRRSRRDLLKAVPVAVGGGAAASAAALALSRSEAEPTETRRGTCRLCVMQCGLVAHVRGERLLRVEGDPKSLTRGFICQHAYALPEIVHHPSRLSAPLVREGGQLRPASWEAAYERIRIGLERLRSEHGPESLVLGTGWPFVRHPLVPWLQRFGAAFGTPNVYTVASLCEASGRMGRALTAGSNFWPEVRLAKTLIVWGANPPVAAPPFAQAVHAMRRPGHELIVVDVRRTDLANQASLFLQVRPGTDLALGLGLIHVILAEKLEDRAYIAKNCSGLDELREAVRDLRPGEVSELTSVPTEKIVEAARRFAKHGPGCIWDGLGIEHHEHGVETVRALASLQAICGYVGKEGGGILHEPLSPKYREEPLPTHRPLRTPEPVPPTPKAPPLGRETFPLYHVFNRQAQGNLLPAAVLEDRPYPVRGLVLFGSNPLVTSPDTGRMRRVLERLSLLVVVDPVLSATAELASVVLPACTFVEGDEHGDASFRERFVPRQGESRPDWQILFELSRVIGLGDYFPWRTLSEANAAPHLPFLHDEERTFRPKPSDEPPRFPTESGRIELASGLMARFGYDAVPTWRTPRFLKERGPNFPLILVTGPRTRAFINSQFHHLDSLTLVDREAYAELHPETASGLGLSDGSRARIVTPAGALELRVRVSDRVHPEAVVVPSGWARGNANVLTDLEGSDPISGFPALRSQVCRLEPVAGLT